MWAETSSLPETFWVMLAGLERHNFPPPGVISYLRESLEGFLGEFWRCQFSIDGV